ncbi:MAG TPA: peptidylprolyl isomerase [Gaiellaceae bacterium]
MRRRLLLLATVTLAATACGGSKQADTTTTTAVDAHGCAGVAQPPPTERNESRPTTKLDPARHYDVTFQTNCGSFTVRLDQKVSPNAAASVASLVQKQFFDHTLFHRIAVGFVIQGGDPTQTGGGGPGYTTLDRPPAGTRYVHGTVAMAKTPSQPAGTAGSQFFVVTAANAGLPPEYALLGHVTSGLAVVDRIGRLGDANQRPTDLVVIEHATLKTS